MLKKNFDDCWTKRFVAWISNNTVKTLKVDLY